MEFFAQIAGGDPLGGWLSLLLQGGSFGLLAYMLVVSLPKEREADRIAQAGTREAFQKALGDLVLAHHASVAHIIEALTELRVANETMCKGG